MKRFIRTGTVFILLISLLVTLQTGAFAASSKATTLRLEDTQGTVSVKSAAGKSLKYAQGTKLYSGYSVATSDASYAWINLDGTSLIKLDEDTSVTIKQSGKKLQVLLDTGKLFFNVSKPLESDESLDIRTSNMSTGIRGTSGLVAVSRLSAPAGSHAGFTAQTVNSSLLVFEGVVQLSYAADTSAAGSAPLNTQSVGPGYLAQVSTTSLVPEAAGGSAAVIDVSAGITPVSVSEAIASTGFAAVEVASDPKLQQAIVQGDNDVTDASLATATQHAQEQLTADQQQSAQQKAEESAAMQETLAQVLEQAAGASGDKNAVTPVFDLPADEPAPRLFTVSFVLNGAQFASQSVYEGSHAALPLLRPSENGSWQLDGADYDFASPVRADIVLTWAAA